MPEERAVGGKARLLRSQMPAEEPRDNCRESTAREPRPSGFVLEGSGKGSEVSLLRSPLHLCGDIQWTSSSIGSWSRLCRGGSGDSLHVLLWLVRVI